MHVHELISVFIISVASQSSKCPTTKNYKKQDEYSGNRLTSITDGNYTILALTTFTVGDSPCSNVSREGLVRAYAIKYAIDCANNDTRLRRWAKIGMRLDDDCASLPVTMARGTEVISMIREPSVCHAESQHCSDTILTGGNPNNMQAPVGIIGTAMSFTTIPLASLMSLYMIPQISFSASSRVLSNVGLYKSFFRTIPSDVNQVSVMLDVIEAFKWNYIFAVGSDDDYGKLGVSELEFKSHKKSICITDTHYVPNNISQKEVNNLIQRMIKSKALVVVLFCYVTGLGDKILKEAKNKNVKRVWLTSDAWDPPAAYLNKDLENQAHGILSVSLQNHKLPEFVKYMTNEVKTDFLCNMWLQNFLKSNFQCEPTHISSDNFFLMGNNCSVAVSDITSALSKFPGKISNLIDAVTVLTRAIQKYLEINCKSDISCSIPIIDYANLTTIVKNITFNNSLGELIKFDGNGDPEFIFYTIENLQYVNNTYKFVPVGNWSKTRLNKSLIIDNQLIKWPHWFDVKLNTSRCSEDCQKGQFVTTKDICCWKCENCTNNNYSNIINADKCNTCGDGYHTVNHIVCEVTPIKWLKYTNTEGMAIIVVSSVGLLLNLVVCILLLKLRQFLLIDGSSPHIMLSCVLPFLTFSLGFLYILQPTVYLCHARNAIFFLLLMAFSSVLMIKTKITRKYLENHFEKIAKGHLLIKQSLLMLLLLMIEVISIIVWIKVDANLDIVENEPIEYEIQRRCFVDFTTARFVSTFVPFILLIIATCCAFHERNTKHPFHEPKFLSFTCIAMCIIAVVFLPTFKYVKGNLKGVVMVFTTSVFGFTYMACLVLPKVFVVHARQQRKDSFSELYFKPSKVSKTEEDK